MTKRTRCVNLLLYVDNQKKRAIGGGLSDIGRFSGSGFIVKNVQRTESSPRPYKITKHDPMFMDWLRKNNMIL